MNILDIALNTTKEYLKAQLIMLGLNIIMLSIGFIILDVPLWFLWALLLAVADLLPIVGTGIFMVPWAIVCFIMGNFDLGGGLLILYTIIVIVRQIVEPVVVGKKIGLHPIYTFLAIIIGGFMFGPVGLICGPIVAAIIKAVMYAEDKNSARPEKRNPFNKNDDYIDV
jgi:predicted PurR-regulated permease PerM